MNIVFDNDSSPNEIYRIPIHTNDPEIYYIDDARFYRMGYNTLIGSMNFRIDIEKAIEIVENPGNSPFINNAFFFREKQYSGSNSYDVYCNSPYARCTSYIWYHLP